MICFFKQKTAYEMRISDWSSDVCSSDLGGRSAGSFGRSWVLLCCEPGLVDGPVLGFAGLAIGLEEGARDGLGIVQGRVESHIGRARDRKSVGEGKSVSVRVDLVGRRIIKKNNTRCTTYMMKHYKK